LTENIQFNSASDGIPMENNIRAHDPLLTSNNRQALPQFGFTLKAATDLPEIYSGSNPLVAAANHLLNLIPQIRTLTQNTNPSGLRDYLVTQVQKFEQLVRNSGATPETAIGARYCLCTALDEAAALTPWGGSGVWGKHSLLVTFHNETWGGEKFFQLLAKIAQNPQQHKDLLELMYFCISLGFEGRYRVVDNGRSQLDALKLRLVGIIKTVRGEHQRALSPHWKGVAADYINRFSMMPMWVVTIATAALAALMYVLFTFWLAALSDGVFSSVGALRMPRISVMAQNKPASALAPFGKFLEREIKEGLVAVRDEPDRSIVILRGDGLFESGSNAIKDPYLPVLARIATALNSVDGKVLIVGFTDDVPIRTLRFPSNWELSRARADGVKANLGQTTSLERITSEGRGDADPLAPNDSSANRARNRRVEITLLLPTTRTEEQTSAGK
jgi:type VI secretion system protein ImpK